MKTFVDLKVTRKPVKPVKPTENSTQPYVNEIPAHFIHDIKTKGYDVIGVNVFLRKLMRFPRKKGVTGPYYTTNIIRAFCLLLLWFRLDKPSLLNNSVDGVM